MKSFKYNYVTVELGERQYDEINLLDNKIVEAIYVKSKIKYDVGNPFIEALPQPREGNKEINNAYFKGIENFSPEQKKKFSRSEKISAITLLRELRFPLPFHQELEEETYNAIVTSYRARALYIDEDIEQTYLTNNVENKTCSKLLGNSENSTSAGFSLIGYSGCGKSSALQILLSNYPQVIMHRTGTVYRFPQIVYLVVNCVPNSNFSALYAAIGNAIDRALGNQESVYERIVEKEKGLGGKADRIRNFIERFAIGLIIFDEIQLIDFRSTRENSFESLMILANRTKVAIAVVGTEDAYEMMFPKLRTGRRLGTSIRGHRYCSNYKYFCLLVNKMMEYQWFDEIIKPDDDLTKALYEESKGIIDQLIGIYMYMQIDYVRKEKNRPKIDARYVHTTTRKHYPGLRELLNNLNNSDEEIERSKLLRKAMDEINTIVDEEKQKSEASSLEMYITSNEQVDSQLIKAHVIESIQMLTDDFTTDTIVNVYEKVMNLQSSEGMSEKEIGQKVFQKLMKSKSDKRPAAKKSKNNIDDKHIDMRNYLLNE